MAKKYRHKERIKDFWDALSRVDPKAPPPLSGDLDDYLWQVSELRENLIAFRDAGPRVRQVTQLKRLSEIDRISDYITSCGQLLRRVFAAEVMVR